MVSRTGSLSRIVIFAAIALLPVTLFAPAAAPRIVTIQGDPLKLNIAADDYDTIGGYVLNQLGAAPKVGTTLKLGTATLRVEAVQGTRIKKVRIRSETPFQIPEANQGQATLSTSPQPVRPGPPPQP